MLEYINIFLRMMSFCMREIKVAWFQLTMPQACDDRPVCISAFYLWILGGGKYSYCVLVIFYIATFFPWYPHLIIRYSNM